MLAIRIIPCLDVAGGRVVKGRRFVDLRDLGDPVDLALRYEEDGADELVLLDVRATLDSRSTMLDVVERVARRVRIPFTVGGGVGSVADAALLLRAGADRIAVNSAAISRPHLVTELAERFGSQAVVAAVDARRAPQGTWSIHSHAGTVEASLDAAGWCAELQRLGAGELLVTSIDNDGVRAGYDLGLLRAVTSVTSIPVIASGGAGCSRHLIEGVRTGGAAALLLAGTLHDGTMTIPTLKRELRGSGLPIR